MILFGIQGEGWGMTSNQRQQGADVALNWLATQQMQSYRVDPEYSHFGSPPRLFVEVTLLESLVEGDELFQMLRTWLSNRAEDGPQGQHSYVWLAQKNRDTRINTIWRAESPGWVTVESSYSLDD